MEPKEKEITEITEITSYLREICDTCGEVLSESEAKTGREQCFECFSAHEGRD